MTEMGGYADRVAWIDLSKEEVEYRGVSEEDAEKYIGGRGLGVKYVADNGAEVDPLSPENVLCLMVGPLTGSDLFMNSRLCATTRSPLTGTVTDSHQGGWTGARLKWAGFDGLVFKGRADGPVYAYVEDGEVDIVEATEIWGDVTSEAAEKLRDRHGEDVSVVLIGPGGENLSRFACLMNEDFRAAGRGGTGCVAGSKNLKAVVIKGSREGTPEAFDEDAFEEAKSEFHEAILESDITAPGEGGLSVYGTDVLMNLVNDIGALPIRNAKATQDDEADRISGETMKDTTLVGEPNCYSCPVACKREYEVGGRYATHAESQEYENTWAFGANCGLFDLEPVHKINTLCNEYGLDTIEFGNCVSVLMEAAEKGLVEEEIDWGDGEEMVALVENTALREGVGDTLSEGCARAAAEFGDPEMANQVKGMGIPAYDPRGLKGMGIGYATSNRGACHLRGYTPASEVLGVPEKTDPQAEDGKAELLTVFQDLHAVSDSLDVCKFSAFAVGAEEYLDVYNAMTGHGLDLDGLMEVGERIYTLERHYNNVHGFDAEDDTLPRKFIEETGTGPASDQVCGLESMLDEYYDARGWDSGVVPREQLDVLGVEAVG